MRVGVRMRVRGGVRVKVNKRETNKKLKHWLYIEGFPTNLINQGSPWMTLIGRSMYKQTW